MAVLGARGSGRPLSGYAYNGMFGGEHEGVGGGDLGWGTAMVLPAEGRPRPAGWWGLVFWNGSIAAECAVPVGSSQCRLQSRAEGDIGRGLAVGKG